MAYIGKEPIVGNFQKCDAITVVNGQAAYTLQVSSTNVIPESSSHMLVSLNGILQAPVTSFTVSGSTLTFASNLATGDVIDFVILLGNVLDLGTPSDGTVTNAKLAQDIISGETALTDIPADTDELLLSDAGTLKRIDYSLMRAGTPSFRVYQNASQSVDSATSTQITLDTEDWDTDSAFASNTFTVPAGKGGKYLITAQVRADPSWAATDQFNCMIYRNGASNTGMHSSQNIVAAHGNSVNASCVIDLAATDTLKLYLYHDEGGAEGTEPGQSNTFMSGVRIG
jgi:hypothetical protein